MNLFVGIEVSFILLVAEARNAEAFFAVEGTKLALVFFITEGQRRGR